MADIEGLYPFATNDGKAIPLDIVRPYGSIKRVFTNDASTSAVSVPEAIQVLTVLSNRDCILQFATAGAVASAYTDGVIKMDAIFIPADILTVLAPPVNKRSFAVIGDFEPEDAEDIEGMIVIQLLQQWAGLSLNAGTQRR